MDAINAAEITMSESAPRTRKQERLVKRVERPKERQIGIHSKGSGQTGTQDLDQYNGKTCAQEIPKDGERASQKE